MQQACKSAVNLHLNPKSSASPKLYRDPPVADLYDQTSAPYTSQPFPPSPPVPRQKGQLCRLLGPYDLAEELPES